MYDGPRDGRLVRRRNDPVIGKWIPAWYGNDCRPKFKLNSGGRRGRDLIH